MASLYLLVPLSIILAFFMGYFFWWSTKNGQFDDLKGPAHRILMDNDDICSEDEQESITDDEHITISDTATNQNDTIISTAHPDTEEKSANNE